MEISPVPMVQVLAGRDGRQYEVSGTAAQVAADIVALDDTLGVSYNETGNFFIVYQRLNEHRLPDKRGHEQAAVLRVAADEWDGRVVDYMSKRAFAMRNGHDPNIRLDEEAAQRKAAREREFNEAVGAWASKAFFSAQRDQGMKPRIFVPREVAA